MRRTASALVVLLVLAGCGAMNAPLANVEPGGRDYAKVDADKTLCWQQAETAHGAHSRTRWMVLGSAAALQYTGGTEPVATRDERIERAAETCMIERGYTVRPK